jgi:neurotransmitter:Na+ symporter, NSS family
VTQKTEAFSSRWLMILAMLGMAVGTGNIWRFPRIAAKNGGGEFLVAWVVFLLIWSIPLILLEFGMGRKTRSGPVKAFIQMMGPGYAWMGAFVAFVATAILFYYSVVAGWTFRYLLASVIGEIPGETPGALWHSFTTSWWPVVGHAIAIGLGVAVVARGVTAIEKVAKYMMPSLLVLVLVLVIRAVTLPGAGDGLSYLFSVDWAALGEPTLWLEALTQNAWDTGAGWGLVLCYAAYMRSEEDTALNAFVVPTANNMISLLAGIMVMCTVFSVVPGLVDRMATNPEVMQYFPGLAPAADSLAANPGFSIDAELIRTAVFAENNEGITFIWMPELFATLPFGQGLMVLFFLALSFAAFTSLMAMVELSTRVFVDAGVPRTRAIRIVGGLAFLLGIPSALSLKFFHNQDWVWAVALMFAGLFFAIAVIRSGVQRFREEQLNHEYSDVRVGRWWNIVITVLVPVQAVVLAGWLLWDARKVEGWMKPFSEYNVGTVVFQFAIVFLLLLAANRWIAARTMQGAAADQPASSAPND